MIVIIKPYWKWKVGDEPTVTIGKAEELVALGVAKFKHNKNGKAKRNNNRRLR